ncbi:L-fucose/L-arabinose isomerase family protein [Jeotgalibaca caeni]|uniref:L-fucose/L-arabinose isomerase family protein n=1 Tax=Jeotgalibaca caeni TaxID=3028623 RepID=UPI00237E07D3|nr:L-fucose/L-arabinose isomerase family protein [Jeotgalibaca caeni]MDE1549814.1 L-fucose/L-arabinose isomerase family protein [Jeotgalibaca caeni]
MIRKTAKIGIVSLGHEPYWHQFEGLKEELIENGRRIEALLQQEKVTVISGGFVDNIEHAFKSVEKLKKNDIDLLFVNLTTYVTSSLAATLVHNLNVPTILIALQPLEKLDYTRTTTYMQLVNDNIVALPEIGGVLERFGKPAAGYIVGTLNNDKRVREELKSWCRVANARRAFKYTKIGYLGHTYEGMYDLHSDPTMFTAFFDSHIQMLEMDDLEIIVNEVDDKEVEKKIEEINQTFEIADPFIDPITKPIKEEDLYYSAKVAVGLDKLIEQNNLSGLAYFYRGEHESSFEKLGASMVLGNSLLTGKGVPLAGEADLKTCAAMLIMDRLEAGGSFAELHPCDFKDDIVLVGHDGPHNINISQGKPIMRGLDLFHGKAGSGIGVEFSIKNGPITILSISQKYDGTYKMIVAEGESLPGDIPKTGNTNTRCKFSCGAAEFVERWSMAGPTHHLALGVGHVAKDIKRIGKIMGIEVVQV